MYRRTWWAARSEARRCESARKQSRRYEGAPQVGLNRTRPRCTPHAHATGVLRVDASPLERRHDVAAGEPSARPPAQAPTDVTLASMTTQTRAAGIVGIAGALAAIAALVVLFAPLQRSVSGVAEVSGGSRSAEQTNTSSSSQSLLESEGTGIIAIAAVPVFVTVLPLLAMRARSRHLFRRSVVAATMLIGLFVVATGFSIGLLYIPALAALVAAVVTMPPARRRF